MTNDRINLLPAVFVIDDDVAVQRSLKALFGALDIRLHTYFSAEAFLASYSDEWTGCLLVDLRMPGMGGIGLLKELRHRGSSLPVILMTGHGEHEYREQAINAGAVGVLEKPFRVEQLKDFIERRCSDVFRGDKFRSQS